jgi:hypothetical protein
MAEMRHEMTLFRIADRVEFEQSWSLSAAAAVIHILGESGQSLKAADEVRSYVYK